MPQSQNESSYRPRTPLLNQLLSGSDQPLPELLHNPFHEADLRVINYLQRNVNCNICKIAKAVRLPVGHVRDVITSLRHKILEDSAPSGLMHTILYGFLKIEPWNLSLADRLQNNHFKRMWLDQGKYELYNKVNIVANTANHQYHARHTPNTTCLLRNRHNLTRAYEALRNLYHTNKYFFEMDKKDRLTREFYHEQRRENIYAIAALLLGSAVLYMGGFMGFLMIMMGILLFKIPVTDLAKYQTIVEPSIPEEVLNYLRYNDVNQNNPYFDEDLAVIKTIAKVRRGELKNLSLLELSNRSGVNIKHVRNVVSILQQTSHEGLYNSFKKSDFFHTIEGKHPKRNYFSYLIDFDNNQRRRENNTIIHNIGNKANHGF